MKRAFATTPLAAYRDKPCSAARSNSYTRNVTQGLCNQRVLERSPDKQPPQVLCFPPYGESQTHTTLSLKEVPHQQKRWASADQRGTIPPSC